MKKDTVAITLLCVAALALGLACCVFAAYQEARTFNELTGGNATTWDAIWVELRVVDTPHAPAKDGAP